MLRQSTGRKLYRSALQAALALATAAIVIATPSRGHADLVEELNKMGAAAGAGAASAQPSPAPAVSATPLGKFTATGRITESIAVGACPGSIEATACGTTSCDALSITGPVSATSLGKSTLTACLTVTNLTASIFASCLNGFGTGTITANNGNSITLAIGGLFCLGDAFPVPTPTTAIFVGSDSYAVEGGTGPFTTAVGSGTVAFSDVVTNLTGVPIAGTGQITIAGTFAKK
jgi:hypothetical protein